MAILGTNLDYTDKDFDSLRARLFNLISSVFPSWTSRQVANFGNLLVELFAFTGDVLLKYQDNQAGESRWASATQRKNLLALAKLIGYEAPTATASQVDVTLSIPAPMAGPTLIASGTVVRTRQVSAPVIFRLLADATIPAGQTSLALQTAENSEPELDTFTSPGTPNLELVLNSVPFLDGSPVVAAANGVYTEVNDFLNSTSVDRHYTVTVDQNDQATIRFGNGVVGAIPTGTITALYKTGGGAAGQVEAGTVEVIEGTFADSFGTPTNVFVTNPEASTPATNRQTVEQIRQAAPASLRTLTRTVSREDYEINAKKLPQVSRALMLTSDEDPAIGENSGYLFIVPVGGGLPTTDLKADVKTQVTVTYPNTLTFQLTVSDPLYLTVDVWVRVFLAKGAKPSAVDAAIRTNLTNFFRIENADGSENEAIDFGYAYLETTGDYEGQLPKSDIFNVIRDTTGVRKIGDGSGDLLLNGEAADVTLLLREFPRLGAVTIINGETGAPLV